MPERIQLKRTKGWRMPPNTVKVDRTTKWGNPFVIGQDNPFVPGTKVKDRHDAWRLYKALAGQDAGLAERARNELRGNNLACWCPLPHLTDEDCCHASVLLALANS